MDKSHLYREIKNDNREAFNALVCSYNKPLHAFAYRIVRNREAADDIVQDVFLGLWINRRKVDFDIPVENYLYVSARNLAYNHLRSVRRLAERLQRIPTEEDSDGYMILEEANRLLSEAIGSLPPRMAETLWLSLEGLKQEEIARRMEVTVANVKRLKAVGIEKLKKYWESFE